MTVKTNEQSAADKAKEPAKQPRKAAKQPASAKTKASATQPTADKAKAPAKKTTADKAKVTAKQPAADKTDQPIADKTEQPVKQPGVVKPEAPAKELAADKTEQPAQQPDDVASSVPVLTVSAAWAPFKADYLEGQRGCNSSTLVSYENDFDRFLTFLGADTLVTEITPADVLGFSTSPHLLNKGMSPNKALCAGPTVKKTLRLAKMFLEWLEAKGHISEAPIPSDLPMGSRSADELKARGAERAMAKSKFFVNADLQQLERAQAKAQELEEALGTVRAAIAQLSAENEEPKTQTSKSEETA